MKFIILTVILNWSGFKYGSEVETKDLFVKASDVTSIVQTHEVTQKESDGRNSISQHCEVVIDKKTYYIYLDSCTEVVDTVNSGLTK